MTLLFQSEGVTKTKRKPNILNQQKPAVRRATTEAPTPKPEEKAHPTITPRRLSISVDDKKAAEIAEISPESARKLYPKRENRKPPAHLAEAFGPALFSTPDIPRRISDAAKSNEGESHVKFHFMSVFLMTSKAFEDI